MTESAERIPPDTNLFRRVQPLAGYAIARRHQPTETKSGLVLPGDAGKGFQPFLEVLETSGGYWENGQFVEVDLKEGDCFNCRATLCAEVFAVHPEGAEKPEWQYVIPLGPKSAEPTVTCKVWPLDGTATA